MGKSAPSPAPPPPPPVPPQTPVRAVGDTDDKTPTEVLAERDEQRQAVVTSPDTQETPQTRTMPASVIDTETEGRKTERELAKRQGRRQTRKTGPQGLLSPAPVSKRGLIGS